MIDESDWWSNSRRIIMAELKSDPSDFKIGPGQIMEAGEHMTVELASDPQFVSSANEHRHDGYDDGAAGVVERSARQHARDLLTKVKAPRGPAIAAAYLAGYLMGVERCVAEGPYRKYGG